MRLERLRRVTCKGGAYCRADVEDYDDVKRFLGPRVSRRWKSGRHEDVHVTRQMANDVSVCNLMMVTTTSTVLLTTPKNDALNRLTNLDEC